MFLLNKKEMRNEYLTNIADREFLVGGVDQREASVFTGKFVCVVDAVIAAITKSGFIRWAEYSGLPFVTYVALDLHSLIIS